MSFTHVCTTCMCIHFDHVQYVATQNGVSFNSRVSSEGYFRPESPWLPGTRKVNVEPVELTSYTATAPPPAPSSSSVSVSHLLVSWKGEQDKVVLRDIGFEVDQVSSI